MRFLLRELDARSPADCHRFLRFVREEDESFTPSLSSRVDLDAYAHRVMQRGQVIMAFNGDDAVGLVAFYCNDKVNRIGAITLLGVKADWRGNDLGRRLLSAGADAMRCAEMVRIRLQTSQHSPAEAMYREFGFEIMAEPPCALGPDRVMMEYRFPSATRHRIEEPPR